MARPGPEVSMGRDPRVCAQVMATLAYASPPFRQLSLEGTIFTTPHSFVRKVLSFIYLQPHLFFSSENKVKINARGCLAGERCQKGGLKKGRKKGVMGPCFVLYSWRLNRLSLRPLSGILDKPHLHHPSLFVFPLTCYQQGLSAPQQQNNRGFLGP